MVEWASYVREDAFGSGLTYVEEGLGTVLDRLGEGLSIRFGTEVVEVRQTESKAGVVCRDPSGAAFERTADHVILAVPPIVLRRVPIQGQSPAKLAAMRNTYHGRAAKVFLQFSERWWDDYGFGAQGGMCMTDLPSRNLVFTVAGQGTNPDHGLMIGSYTWEADAMVLENLTPEVRVREVFKDVCSIYPEAADSFEGGYAHNWGSDPFAGGVGALFRPYEMSGPHYRSLIEPVGRVYFAGDAYDRRHRRWIEGAIRSGIKQARSIRFGTEIPLDRAGSRSGRRDSTRSDVDRVEFVDTGDER